MKIKSLLRSREIATLLPSCTSRSCRAAAFVCLRSLILTVTLAIGARSSNAFAQDEPPDDDGAAVEIVGWSLLDPVNHAESRQFFAGLWAAEDAGLQPPEFEFTNTPPGLMTAMLLPELEVFTEVYRHRLLLEFDDQPRYIVTDLLETDAAVRAEFRAFVLTGKLAPRPEVDTDAYLAHFGLVLDATTTQHRATIVSVNSLGMLIESEGMSVELHSPLADEPSFPWPHANDVSQRWLCALKYLSTASRVDCMVAAGLYYAHSSAIMPDFDCDDIADALIRFLRARLPHGTDVKTLLLYWNCGSAVSGHAVVIIRSPEGNWYWIEPQKNTVRGPFVDERGATVDALDHASRLPGLAGCSPKQALCHSRAPVFGKPLFEGEAPPWYTSPAQIVRFCERLAQCCGQFVTLPPEDTDCTPADFVQLPFVVNGCSIDDYTPRFPDTPPGQVPPIVPPAIWSHIPCHFPSTSMP
jgi:hypothetical protein